VTRVAPLVYFFQRTLATATPVLLRAKDGGLAVVHTLIFLDATAVFPVIYLMFHIVRYLAPPALALAGLLLMALSIAFGVVSWLKSKAVIGLYATF